MTFGGRAGTLILNRVKARNVLGSVSEVSRDSNKSMKMIAEKGNTVAFGKTVENVTSPQNYTGQHL